MKNFLVGKLMCKILVRKWMEQIEVVGEKIVIWKIGIKNSNQITD